MKLTCNKANPPLGGILAAAYVKIIQESSIELEWSTESVMHNGNQKIVCESSNDLLRAIARLVDEKKLYGSNPSEKTEVDSWLTFSIGPLASKNDFCSAIDLLNKVLAPLTYLVGKRITIADFAVFSTLYVTRQWQCLISDQEAPKHLLRWYNFMQSFEFVSKILLSLPNDVKAVLFPMPSRRLSERLPTAGRKQEGKFIDLPEAKMGEVVVRFPPEASGYLHIGHAKAALLNQYYQQAFQGKLIMRFDDTNPAKEDAHFEQVILKDLELLEIKPDMFTHTSQYFDVMLEYCEKLLKDGKAYVDDTEPEKMKLERDQRVESVNRNNTYEKNLSLWEEMKRGTVKGQTCCVRAKIDMQSLNGCMRDPTIYRCKNEPHPRTGTQYKVYPTYDFACPIVDAIEGVTHTLRTMEYHDRDPQFYWFIDALGLRKPYIWEYSRLSMTNTVLSKRKLTWFVQEKLVDGWDDPRLPTVRGVLRRGMTVEGLKQFIIAQGSSRSVVFMEWDKIWAFNKKVIDPIAPRFTALDRDSPVPIFIEGVKEETFTVPKHPKNADVGEKVVWVGPKILIDRCDADLLKEGENATFINWGNLMIKNINRENGKIKSVNANPNLDNKDYKKTVKLTWLAQTDNVSFTPTWCVYFDHIISKPLLGKDEDFKQFIGQETRKEFEMLGDPELRKVKKGDIIQLQRRGFFKVDAAYEPASLYTCREQPVILFYIPDGHSKDNLAAVGNNSKMDNEVVKNATGRTECKTAAHVNAEIIKQGDIVRNLKLQQAPKGDIDNSVKTLLALKAEYKALTNTEWKPAPTPSEPATVAPVIADTFDLNERIMVQGDKVRKQKSEKADKEALDSEVKILLNLKAEYKQSTGKDWKPIALNPAKSPAKAESKLDVNLLMQKIVGQGDKIRALKTNKVNKATIDDEVKVLLALKADYKKLTGKDWQPEQIVSVQTANVADESTILQKITEQGDKVRELKAKKVDKATIDIEIKTLLGLKAEYKNLTGKDWKPGAVVSANVPVMSDTCDEVSLLQKITAQGDNVRDLKLKKADKAVIGAEVKILLSLKTEYKNLTGKDWKPDTIVSSPAPTTITMVTPPSPVKDEGSFGDSDKEALTTKINEQGNEVRTLKSSKAPKEQIDCAVKTLLALKDEYKILTGTDFPAPGRPRSKSNETKQQSAKEKVQKQKGAIKEKKPVDVEDGGVKKQTRLGLEAKKEENLSDWYSQVITKGEMIEYYDVSGCYIFRPWSFAIWEAIKDWFDAEIKKIGVQNCYFPIFVSKSVLEKEKTHIADFAPEVAWVTKSGESELAEPIAVRPTSETVMYPAYAKWIQSYRDLPIKLNQWNNVVRWEFKHPQPFLRTREFLWQEGHTAYAIKDEAEREVTYILDLYAKIYTDLLAIPVVKGRKTEKEKFAGGDYTYTVEAFVSASGRAIQGATSHHLGQNFSKMFDIIYEDPETQEKKYVYQNSWGLTTRTIGVMIMVHADNQGLVLPPKVASVQVVIVPCGITVNLSEADRAELQASSEALEADLKAVGIKVKGDYRDNYSPGWKFNHWELKGVPIRLEIGPKDIKNKQLVVVRRDTGEKIVIKRDAAISEIKILLDNIQQNLYQKACKELTSHIVQLTDWSDFGPNLDKKNLILAPFCGETPCEDKIKADSTRDDADAEPGAPSMGAKTLCIPIDQPDEIKPTNKCIHPDCKNKPLYYTLFGRSY